MPTQACSDWEKSRYTEMTEMEHNGKVSLYSARLISNGESISFWRINLFDLPDSVLDTIAIELKHIKTYQHPSLVKVLNVATDDDGTYAYIEMEPVSCTLLRFSHRFIATGEKVPEPIIWNAAESLLDGLSYLHLHENPTPFLSSSASKLMHATDDSKKINNTGVHASITSSTVLVSSDNVVKLGLFGLSESLSELYSLGCYEVPRCFRAPEIANYTHSLKSDIWALGATLVDMCVESLAKHDEFSVNPDNWEHPDLDKYVVHYSPKLTAFLTHCLQFNVAKRHLTNGLIDELNFLKPASVGS